MTWLDSGGQRSRLEQAVEVVNASMSTLSKSIQFWSCRELGFCLNEVHHMGTFAASQNR